MILINCNYRIFQTIRRSINKLLLTLLFSYIRRTGLLGAPNETKLTLYCTGILFKRNDQTNEQKNEQTNEGTNQ